MPWDGLVVGLFALLGIAVGAVLERWRDESRCKREGATARIERLGELATELVDSGGAMIVAIAEIVRSMQNKGEPALGDAADRAQVAWRALQRLLMCAVGELPSAHPGQQVIMSMIAALNREMQAIYDGDVSVNDRQAVLDRLTDELSKVVGVLGSERRKLEGEKQEEPLVRR